MDNNHPAAAARRRISIGIDPALNVGVFVHTHMLDGGAPEEAFQALQEDLERRAIERDRFDPRLGG